MKNSMKDRFMAWISVNASTLGLGIFIVVVLLMIAGCSTVSGFGKDVTGAAEWTKDKMSGTKL